MNDIFREIEYITTFITHTVTSRGFSQVVIACSGGVDSTTSLYLSAKALGKKNVYALLLPYKDLHPEGKHDALLALNMINIPKKNIIEVNIAPIVDMLAKKLNLVSPETLEDKIRLGNIMARCRMIIIYDYSKRLHTLVMGTENKSEHHLSYYTRFGDEASDIEPIRHLYKTQVYELARMLGIPEVIVNKPPTAGLWPGQTDENQFGFSYKDADDILEALYEKKLSVEKIVQKGFSQELILKVKKWVESNSFKHDLPIVFSHTMKQAR